MAVNLSPGRPANVLPHPALYWFFWGVGVAMAVIMLRTALKTWGVSLYDGFDGGPTALLFVLIYLAFSEKIVRENEVAAAFSYGKALVVLTSGLHFVPFGLMQIRKGPRTVQEFQCPADPEKVLKEDDKKDLPAGMVRPIRVVTGGPQKGRGDDLLNTRMTIVVNFFVQWAITDVLDYASNYGSVAEVQKQVRDIGEALLAEIAVEHSTASFIDGLQDINSQLATGMRKRFKNSGVRIISTRQVSPDVSHPVSTALAAIPIAKATAKQVVIGSEGEKTRLKNVGDGVAVAELALLNAKATGRKANMDALDVDGEAVLASEAVRELSAKTDVLVVGAKGGMKDVMGLIKGAQSALKPKTT